MIMSFHSNNLINLLVSKIVPVIMEDFGIIESEEK